MTTVIQTPHQAQPPQNEANMAPRQADWTKFDADAFVAKTSTLLDAGAPEVRAWLQFHEKPMRGPCAALCPAPIEPITHAADAVVHLSYRTVSESEENKIDPTDELPKPLRQFFPGKGPLAVGHPDQLVVVNSLMRIFPKYYPVVREWLISVMTRSRKEAWGALDTLTPTVGATLVELGANGVPTKAIDFAKVSNSNKKTSLGFVELTMTGDILKYESTYFSLVEPVLLEAVSFLHAFSRCKPGRIRMAQDFALLDSLCLYCIIVARLARDGIWPADADGLRVKQNFFRNSAEAMFALSSILAEKSAAVYVKEWSLPLTTAWTKYFGDLSGLFTARLVPRMSPSPSQHLLYALDALLESEHFKKKLQGLEREANLFIIAMERAFNCIGKDSEMNIMKDGDYVPPDKIAKMIRSINSGNLMDFCDLCRTLLPNSELKKCGQCKVARFCSLECQVGFVIAL